jgi:hypothetical protein
VDVQYAGWTNKRNLPNPERRFESMIVVALFDRAFVKKKPPTAIKKESHEPGSPNRMTNMGSLKPKPSAVPKHYTKAQQQAGCSPETQRVRTFG